MALTYTIRKKSVTGNVRRHLVNVNVGVAGDYSSGLTITPAGCGLAQIDVINPVGADVGVTLLFDPVSLKLRAYKSAGSGSTHTEAAGSDLATKNILVEVLQYVNG